MCRPISFPDFNEFDIKPMEVSYTPSADAIAFGSARKSSRYIGDFRANRGDSCIYQLGQTGL